MVSYLELHVPLLWICVAFLSALRHEHPSMDLLNSLRSQLHSLGTQILSLTNFFPKDKQSALPTIQHLTRSHPYSCLITIVVGKLNQRNILIPRSPKVHHTCSQHVLQYLDSPLRLSVYLRMDHVRKHGTQVYVSYQV